MINRLGEPVNVKLLLCSECGIATSHHKTKSGLFVCWCGNVYKEPQSNESGQGLIEVLAILALVAFVVFVVLKNVPW